MLACVAGGTLERVSGGGAAIFPRGLREEFASGKAASKFNSTLHQSSHGFSTRVHGFATKTKALAHEILPPKQARNVLETFLSHLKTVFYFQNKAVYRAEDRLTDICLKMTFT